MELDVSFQGEVFFRGIFDHYLRFGVHQFQNSSGRCQAALKHVENPTDSDHWPDQKIYIESERDELSDGDLLQNHLFASKID